ncbi:MAG: bifunctional [glutamate--ammonia ligase]-adenylyl-L-tyrosine phosphorylase/[glutamate--ammonia-ligase] adenylyltransferase [Rhodoferax sp.]|uniref:bifunctional [glutamate--ammonia ligase]-adenylyl-L-tyrosine phosphorylase/[glutamate--ammonia-ligase] adenylyltransferase n=1 Tax=Rhodoferax sp. TaxID=50421 RepID=UPI0026154D4F|nr:bifunctional [glutamate--ammonia ligase]-adenylyl-L-tyrosine phosphorylase/[glutamate--ammonia-ligase] adenylyltransferase [Rhodoferax sp.]MDD2881570.1 bifunctional [glutamate--ammonia ligase]-adenylyl-L-tyrosine phosphorylase/[glutamate--ammonia-ligase] adenylyltransferase [Rhodoferax sp.]
MTGPFALHSRFAQRIHRRYEGQLHVLPPGTPGPTLLKASFDTLKAQGQNSANALRITRQLVIERLMQLDCEQQLPLADVTQAMTDLAEFALNEALTEAQAAMDATHGAPLTASGQRAQLWIVGMGKLGARELNVSSDIDLIYVYDEDGDTTGVELGRGRITNHEYFGKVVRAVYALVGDTTEHGFVFRVDLALRPNGNSGPAAVSLDALEEYLHVQGREWERFAWLKSRVVAPTESVTSGAILALRQVVMPFVFRRYLDYSVFDSLRVLHRQIREHASRRSAGHPERANDVKLSRGGIREIEFTVQLLQVVRGGQFPELRTRPTLSALPRLVRAGLMQAPAAEGLAKAYVFLRQLEHRIQYLDDQQTHVLPTQDQDLSWIAQTMGFETSQQLLSQLDAHRELVAQEFDKLLGGPEPECKGCQNGKPANANGTMEDLLPQLGDTLRQRLDTWRDNPRILALRDEARARLMRLLSRTAQWVKEGVASEAAAVRLVDWVEPLLRRESYLALLLERPNVHERLLRLLGAARWPAKYLMLHPGVIDELAASDIFFERFNAEEFEADLDHRRNALKGTGEDDDEALLNLLRRAHHAEVFRTLARDVEGKLTVEEVADDLSALADAVLRVTTRWCWSLLKKAHREQPRFGIIAYGKLGGKELGYGSDLDIVFVYDDDDENAPEAYAALVRKLINWLTVKTGEGDLYEIDTALRPNGNAGLLITSFASYANYQQQRGSNTAWTWEHQAMTRARCVLGDAALRERFDAVRLAVITAPRDSSSLRQEIAAMRERMAHAHPEKPGKFDIKYSPGGMIDAEFVMQFLVLSQAASHPELLANAGNIALLERAQALGLLPDGVGHAAASAYRIMRQMQHKARLDEAPIHVAPEQLQAECNAILTLWHTVFTLGEQSGQPGQPVTDTHTVSP